MANDLQDRIDAVSIPELRRKVNLAVSYIRELRHALAVECGMALEDAPSETIPKLDPAAANRVLEDLIEMLPLLRKPLSPEEKARLRPVSAAQTEQMKEVVDELVAATPEDLANAGLEISHEKLVAMRESFDKTDMLGEVERELLAYMAELQEHKRRLAESAAEMMARIQRATAGSGEKN